MSVSECDCLTDTVFAWSKVPVRMFMLSDDLTIYIAAKCYFRSASVEIANWLNSVNSIFELLYFDVYLPWQYCYWQDC